MDDMKHVTYCGLYCKLCANIARIPRQAAALRDTLAKGGWTLFGESVFPGFGEFWKVLERFGNLARTCPGCRGDCGYPACEIRKCARQRGVEVCPSCDRYPCEHIEQLAQKYPTLIPDGRRQQQVGLPQWIREQEARVASGACYADFCYPPQTGAGQGAGKEEG